MSAESVLQATTAMWTQWQKWHDPFIVPERRWMEDIVTEDFTLLYSSKQNSVVCENIDEYITLAKGMVAVNCDCRMEWKVLGIGDDYCFVSDRHIWTIGDERFTSDRIDVMEERDGKICRARVLPYDPYAFDAWWEPNVANRIAALENV